jgi:hypothetical protein
MGMHVPDTGAPQSPGGGECLQRDRQQAPARGSPWLPGAGRPARAAPGVASGRRRTAAPAWPRRGAPVPSRPRRRTCREYGPGGPAYSPALTSDRPVRATSTIVHDERLRRERRVRRDDDDGARFPMPSCRPSAVPGRRLVRHTMTSTENSASTRLRAARTRTHGRPRRRATLTANAGASVPPGSTSTPCSPEHTSSRQPPRRHVRRSAAIP